MIFDRKHRNLCTDQERTCESGTGKAGDLHLLEKRWESKVSSTYICLHDLLCECGAGIELPSTGAS